MLWRFYYFKRPRDNHALLLLPLRWFGIWICDPDPEIDSLRWDYFKEHTGFGKLVWDVSERQPTVNSLELRISLHPSGRITTRLYEKALNLHLYLSPLSAHPPGLLSGLVHGMLYWIIMLTSDLLDTREDIQKLFFRLRNRGYPHSQLLPLFRSAYKKITRRLHCPLPPIDAPLIPNITHQSFSMSLTTHSIRNDVKYNTSFEPAFWNPTAKKLFPTWRTLQMVIVK
jgi:hypothetical protein